MNPLELEIETNGLEESLPPTFVSTTNSHADFLKKLRGFYSLLCYRPLWQISDSEPDQLIYQTTLMNRFRMIFKTGLSSRFTQHISMTGMLQVFDLRKRLEISNLRYTFLTDDLFNGQDKEIKFSLRTKIDTYPIYLGSQKNCPNCSQSFDLIIPQNQNQLPFWAHQTRQCKFSISFYGRPIPVELKTVTEALFTPPKSRFKRKQNSAQKLNPQ